MLAVVKSCCNQCVSFLAFMASHLSRCDPITHLRVFPNPPMPCATEPCHCVRGADGEQTLLRNTSSTQKRLAKNVLFIQCVLYSHITGFSANDPTLLFSSLCNQKSNSARFPVSIRLPLCLPHTQHCECMSSRASHSRCRDNRHRTPRGPWVVFED